MAIADYALTTLADLKVYLGITGAGDDAVWESLIDRVASLTERITGRKLKYDETGGITEGVYAPGTTPDESFYDGTGYQTMHVRQWPIESISLIRVRDTTTSSWVTVESDDYVQYADTGRLALASAVLPVTGVWPRGKQTVEITYNAGYDFAAGSLPGDVTLFQWLTAAYFFKMRKRDPAVQAETLTGVHTYKLKDVDPQHGIPRDLVAMVTPFARMNV